MRTLKLTNKINNSIAISLESIIYPNDHVATYRGKSFAKKRIEQSVHFKTCNQIAKGIKINDMHYYNWMIEKLVRLGREYEDFLFYKSKGCGIDVSQKTYLDKVNKDKRYNKMAEIVTQKFIDLYRNIIDDWNPELSTDREITFFKIGSKFMINEGRHRIGVLFYKCIHQGYTHFETDTKNIMKNYYMKKIRSRLRKTIKIILKFISKE